MIFSETIATFSHKIVIRKKLKKNYKKIFQKFVLKVKKYPDFTLVIDKIFVALCAPLAGICWNKL